VLHDFLDTQALQIIQGVCEAITAESILLFNENNLPEQDVPLFNAEIDFSVMVIFSSLERTEKQWVTLLEGQISRSLLGTNLQCPEMCTHFN
jgi:hypothetical protein